MHRKTIFYRTAVYGGFHAVLYQANPWRVGPTDCDWIIPGTLKL